jgi:hypothetical protein
MTQVSTMSTFSNFEIRTIGAIAALAVMSITMVVASPGGYTGRTLKTNRSGCGSCHGSSATSSVSVVISGPDTVIVGKAAAYTLTISGGPARGAGCDIAAKFGTLAAVSSSLKLSGGELTQRSNTAMSGGQVVYQFTYTAPASRSSDTLYGLGLSANSSGGTSGDSWNWSANKGIVIATQTGTADNTMVAASSFSLESNSPNPFNASTEFRFSLGASTFTTLKVYNLQGAEVATVVSDVLGVGTHAVRWNSGSLPAGVYLYRLQAGLLSHTRKLVITR